MFDTLNRIIFHWNWQITNNNWPKCTEYSRWGEFSEPRPTVFGNFHVDFSCAASKLQFRNKRNDLRLLFSTLPTLEHEIASVQCGNLYWHTRCTASEWFRFGVALTEFERFHTLRRQKIRLDSTDRWLACTEWLPESHAELVMHHRK